MRKIYSLLLALFALCAVASAEVITVTPTAVNGSQDGIAYSTEKNEGSTAPTYNANGLDLRVYAKGSITVTSNVGDMTSIVFNISTQGKKRLAPITASTGSIATQAAGDETVTWTGSASSITFTVGDKANYGSDGDTKAGQFDFTSFEVTVGAANPNYVAAPRITPATGTYYEAQTVTITAGNDCKIYYTTDGSAPVNGDGMTTGSLYENPFTVSETTTVKAIAVKNDATAFLASDVTESVITIAQASRFESIPSMKAAAQDLGTDKLQCEMNTNGLTVIGIKGKNLYVVDYTGEGILLYGESALSDGTQSTALKIGDQIGGTIRGELQLFRGAVELGSIDLSNMSLNHQDVNIEPKAATIAQLTGADRLNYESGLVKVSGLTFAATALASSNITAKDATGAEITVRDNYGVLADYPFSTSATYDVTAIVAYFNGSVQLYPRSADEVVKVSGGDEPTPQPHQLVGDGSLQNPYTVEDINSFAISAKTDTIQKEAWVKGVIFGYVNGGSFNANGIVAGSDMSTLSSPVASNIILVEAGVDAVTAMPALTSLMPVNFATSPAAAKKVREALNLADNGTLVGTTIWLNGTITQYMNANGLKEVLKYSLDGQTILPSDDEPGPGPQPGTEIDWTSSAEAPLTVADAMAKGNQLEPRADSGKEVYVKGFVASVEEIANGKAKYYIADQAAGNTTQLYIYNGKGLNGADIAEGGLKQGDEVIVVGIIKNYQTNDGSVIEMTGSKLYSLNGQTSGGDTPQPQVEYAAAGSGTLADPYNVDAVREFNSQSTNETDKPEIWVKGVIIGYINGNSLTADSFHGSADNENVRTNIVIIDAAHNSEAAMPSVDYMVPVQLPNGAVRDALNLADNGSLLGKTVWLCADAMKYMGVSALRNVKKYSFDGTTILPGGDEPGPGPQPGTEIDWTSSAEAPLTVAATMEKAAGLAASAEGDEIYVKGYVTSIDEINTQHGNGTYYIADNAAGDATQLYVYRGKSLGGANFASEDELAVGDVVVLQGKMKNYVNKDGESTLELVSSKIYSRNGKTEPDEPQPIEVVRYENLPAMRAAAHGLGTAKQDAELNTNGLTIIGVKGKQLYAVDYTNEGGILLYGDNTLNLAVGQTIGGTIKGKLQLYNGVAELGDVDYSGMSVLPNSVPAQPVEATIADIVNNTVKYESGLVILKGLNFGEATAFTQNTTAYDESDNEITVRDNYNTYTGQAITPGADYDVTAIVAIYNEAPQLYPRSIDDIVKSGEADLQVPTSEWTSDNVFCGPDEVVNVQFQTNSDGAVTYSSSDESVATVDANGVITTHAVGTATITATTAATATFRSSSDWVNIIVNDNSQGSKTQPYSPEDIIARGADAEDILDVWVRGYIVGYVTGQSLNSGSVFFRDTPNDAPATRAGDEVSNTNLLLATNVEETNIENCIPVQLPAGDVRDNLNLRDHPELAFAEVELFGNAQKYFGVAGFKSVRAYEIIGVDVAVRAISADIDKDAAIYTIDGRRVSAITKPGLYIVGGRKVVVK